MERHILYNSVPSEVIEALTLPKQRQRFLYYTDKLPKTNFKEANYAVDDQKVCYSQSIVALKMGANLYLQRSKRMGFTYDKVTKKITMWFGSGIKQLDIQRLEQFLVAVDLEWVVNEKFSDGWLTKTLLEKIFSGTITNPKDACAFIIKQNKLNCSPRKLQQYIKKGLSKIDLLYIKDVAINLDRYVDGSCHPPSVDLIKQAKALGRTIDFYWSANRMNEVHQQWTQELMAMELTDMPDEPIGWPEIELPKGIELINSKRRLFEEGTKMHHCVFTNYLSDVMRKKYIVLHITDEYGKEATAGLVRYNANKNGFKVDQIKAKHNALPSTAALHMVRRLIESRALKFLFKDETVIDSPYAMAR